MLWPLRATVAPSWILCSCVLFAATAGAQSRFASRVVSFDDRGQAGGGVFQPTNVLGAPDGAVHSLGIGGNVVAGFDVIIADGPGADLIIGENPFRSTTDPRQSFAEAVFVEVSSDGVNFARIPSFYYGPPTSPGPFGFINVGDYDGLAGISPLNSSASDPLDVVDAGGDAIDLADLANDPLVRAGLVNLRFIREVRLVDVRDGIDRDSRGVTIHDPGSGSADIDAIAVVHDTVSVGRRGPEVDVVVPADGAFELAVDDPDGVGDLDPTSVRIALFGVELPLSSILPLMTVTRLDATGFTLKLKFALPPGFALRVSASAKDRAGNRSGDSRSRPLN